jgi:hypothetical protein
LDDGGDASTGPRSEAPSRRFALKVRDEAANENEIERTAAGDLIGDALFAAAGIPRFGWGHGLFPDRSREG